MFQDFKQQCYHSILRHKIYFRMYSNCEDDNFTRESQNSQVWSDERQVYYYSNFDLFNSIQCEEQFYQFSTFGDKVNSELGPEWKYQASLLYSPYLSGKEVFLHLLELWLRYHPPVNSLRSSNTKSNFNQAFLVEYSILMSKQVQLKCPNSNFQCPYATLKAVCIGFYMTANQVWDELFKPDQSKNNGSFLTNILLKGVTNTIQKTIRPLMVVTEKISSVFGRKKRKLNEDISNEQGHDAKFENCYLEFRKTMDVQKQLERKMGDFSFDDIELKSSAKIIQKKEFNESQSPLQPTIISSLYSYVTEFLNKNPTWSVASQFVTQILELNQTIIDNGKRVKIMRPAQDFYLKLVMVWIFCQQNVDDSFSFETFLSKLKSTFFTGWNEKYNSPAKYFFQKMKINWQQIKLGNIGKQVTEKQFLGEFIRRVRGCLQQDWDFKIKINKNK